MPHAQNHQPWGPGGDLILMDDPSLVGDDGSLQPTAATAFAALPGINNSPDWMMGRPTGEGGKFGVGNLFDNLNRISLRNAAGAGRGGGAQNMEGNMDANPLIALNEYMGENVTSFNYGGKYKYDEGGEYRFNAHNAPQYVAHKPGSSAYKAYVNQGVIPKGETTFDPYTGRYLSGGSGSGINRSVFSRSTYDQGGQLSPKEMKKVQGLGRNGDTQLAHINPQEAAMLKAMGGSGTINPYTGLREYGWFSNLVGGLSDVVGGVMGGVSDIVNPILEPIFDAAGNLVDPVADVAGDAVSAVGGAVETGIDAAVDLGTDVLKTAGHASNKIIRAVGEPISDIIDGPMDFLSDFVGGIPDALGDLFAGDEYSMTMSTANPKYPDRNPLGKNTGGSQSSGLKLTNKNIQSNIEKSSDPSGLRQGDWVGDKENPFVTPNVEEELDYAAKGMKMSKYNEGGAMHKMPDGTMMPGATHPGGYANGGYFSQKANEAIAQNQLSGLVANLQNKNNTSNMLAANGMKMPSSNVISELQRMIPNPQDATNLVNQISNQPMANHGMKMHKRYTQGGRF